MTGTDETPFHGEGYRKVRARLAHRGLAVGGERVLRLMRQHQLLAPRRLGLSNVDPAHAGKIITTRPNEMWGTDATRFYTEQAENSSRRPGSTIRSAFQSWRGSATFAPHAP